MSNFSYKKRDLYWRHNNKRSGNSYSLLYHFFENTRFQASKKDKAVIDESYKENDTKYKNEGFFEEESDEAFTEQDF